MEGLDKHTFAVADPYNKVEGCSSLGSASAGMLFLVHALSFANVHSHAVTSGLSDWNSTSQCLRLS